MAKLEDTTPTAEELSGLAEKFGYTPEEVDVLTPTERAEMLAEGEEGTTAAGAPNAAPGEGVLEDADELENRGYANRETDARMPHAREAEPKAAEAAPAKVDSPAAKVDEPAKPAADPAAAAAAEPAPAAAAAEATTDEDGEDPFVVKLAVPATRDYKAELEAVATEFEKGDITTVEHTTRVAEIAKAQAHADFVTDFNAQAETQGWERQQRVFLGQHKEYDFKTNPVRFSALDGALKAIGRTEPTLGNWAALQKAHSMVEKELGAAKAPAPAPAVDPAPAADPKPKPAARAKPDLSLVPQTLANVPSAADHEDGGDKFAFIDKLNGLDQERAIANLSERELDQYLQRASA